MYRQPETAATPGIVADVEHCAAGLGICTMQAVYAAAQRQNVFEQAEIGKHRQPGRLQDQPGPDRFWLVEALEDRDPMSGALEIERGGKSSRPGAGNRDVQRIAHLPAQPRPDNPSALSLNQAAVSAWRLSLRQHRKPSAPRVQRCD